MTKGIASATLKKYVTSAGLNFYTKNERWHDFKTGFSICSQWEYVFDELQNKNVGHNYHVGLEYFGGHQDNRHTIAILTMRLWLTEQGIPYQMDGEKIILLPELLAAKAA